MAANSYTTSQIYVVVKKGEVLPESLREFKQPGEGTANGTTADGRTWFKDCYIGKDGIGELRDLVHAEDAGTLEIKDASEMRALMPVAIEEIERL